MRCLGCRSEVIGHFLCVDSEKEIEARNAGMGNNKVGCCRGVIARGDKIRNCLGDDGIEENSNKTA